MKLLSWIVLLLPSYYCSATEQSLYSVLGVGITATKSDIRNAYRKIALEIHPDKLILVNATKEELEDLRVQFLKVQEAYEVLSDPEKKLKYDLSLAGVDYDILSTSEEDRYKSGHFKFYARSSTVKLSFEAHFPPISAPDLNLVIEIPFVESLSKISKSKSYFRRRVCPDCLGLGGTCRPCLLCSGSGIAAHYFGSLKSQYEHITTTQCGGCGGTGCKIVSVCPRCNKKGFIMEENNIAVDLPAGIRNGYQQKVENAGHEMKDGRRGDLILTCNYVMPPGWSIHHTSGDIMHTIYITLDDFVKGTEKRIVCPSGEDLTVTLSDRATLPELLSGVDIIGSGLGAVVDDDGNRADIVIHFEVDWASVTPVSLAELYLKYGFNVSQPFQDDISADISF